MDLTAPEEDSSFSLEFDEEADDEPEHDDVYV